MKGALLNGCYFGHYGRHGAYCGRLFILKGAYTTSACTDVTRGTVIDGYCYTLEYPCEGWAGSDESGFPDPIASDDLNKLTDTYYVSLGDLYTNSYTCQNETGDYGVIVSVIRRGSDDKYLPSDLLLQSSVFMLKYTGANSTPGSPCQTLTNNETASTPEVGVTYIPSNLADIFTNDFCYCSGGNRECTSL